MLGILQYIRVSFFFNDTATTEIYTLSLHDALPISKNTSTGFPASNAARYSFSLPADPRAASTTGHSATRPRMIRSEEHTSELQSQSNLACRLLLEKNKYEP